MNWKKGLKITGIILGILLVVIGGSAAYIYYVYYGKFPVDETKYTNHVGYIDPQEALFTENFELCESDDKGNTFLLGSYSSSDPAIYRGTKYTFRNYILDNYSHEAFSDTGLLNLRFHINCHGKTGNLIVNQLDTNYKKTNFHPELVAQLTELTMRNENWQVRAESDNTFSKHNHYMYIIYKLENGAITEILP